MKAATKECPSCAMDVPENADVCPICQYEFAQTTSTQKGLALVAIVLLIIFLLGFIFI